MLPGRARSDAVLDRDRGRAQIGPRREDLDAAVLRGFRLVVPRGARGRAPRHDERAAVSPRAGDTHACVDRHALARRESIIRDERGAVAVRMRFPPPRVTPATRAGDLNVVKLVGRRAPERDRRAGRRRQRAMVRIHAHLRLGVGVPPRDDRDGTDGPEDGYAGNRRREPATAGK